MRVQFLHNLIIIHAYFSELGVECSQSCGIFHRSMVGFYHMKLLAEYPRFYERGFREQSNLLEQCQKTDMLLVRKTYHHTILCCVRNIKCSLDTKDSPHCGLSR